MAKKRMFSQEITDSDAFLDMPATSQNLYFHLCLHADDDGFVNSPKRVQRNVGASDDDMSILKAKRFVLDFASGVIVIKHWRMHNYLRGDRYKETQYLAEKSMLYVKPNRSYTFDAGQAEKPAFTCGNGVGMSSGIPTVDIWATQSSRDKSRLDKSSSSPTIDDVENFINSEGLSIDAEKFYYYNASRNWINDKGDPIKWRPLAHVWDKNERNPKRKPIETPETAQCPICGDTSTHREGVIYDCPVCGCWKKGA